MQLQNELSWKIMLSYDHQDFRKIDWMATDKDSIKKWLWLVNRMIDYPGLSTAVLILDLKVLLPWKSLNIEMYEIIGHLAYIWLEWTARRF